MAPNLGTRANHRVRANTEHSSGPISSLLVAGNVANDVGDVLVAFFLVGDEGRIIVIVVLEGLVGLDVVFRFRTPGVASPTVLLGGALFQRDQFLVLGGLRRGFGGRSGRGSGAGCRV